MPANARSSDETSLCRRACRGDRAAQAAIYERHAGAVFTLALRMLRHRPLAEEALQETFVKVLTKLDRFRGDAALSTWIRRVAVNECLQLLRSPWRQRAEMLREEPAGMDSPGRRIDLERALARLPDLTRAVVLLHDVEGYTHREIAAMLGRSVSFSKSRLARGHTALREDLDSEEDASACMPVLNNS